LSDSVEQAVAESLADFAPGIPPVLTALTAAISEHLGCAPVTRGTTLPHESGDVDFVFLDYYLETGKGGGDDAAKAESKRVAREIVDATKASGHQPIIVLMSSRPPSEDDRRELRNDLDLVEDVFYFFPKSDFADPDLLYLKIEALKKRRTFGIGAQRFAEALGLAVSDASKALVERIYDLRIEDYVLVHALSLREEGEPLGDYMLWLFGAFVGRELLESNASVKGARGHLDEMRASELLPFHLLPSSALRDMYGAALYADVDGLASAVASTESGETVVANAPLRLGHVFQNTEGKVWVVINADCDLMSRPASEDAPADDPLHLDNPELSIVLLPGNLFALDKPVSNSALRTDLYDDKGEARWISWQPGQVITVPYVKIDMWAEESGARVVKRIRPEYALHLQREFSAKLTRVGLPVSPPIAHPVTGRLYGPKEGGGFHEIHEFDGPAGFVRIDRKGKLEWVCTIDVAATLATKCREWADAVDQKASVLRSEAANPDVEGGKRLKGKAQVLEREATLLRDPDLRASLVQAHRVMLGKTGAPGRLAKTPIGIQVGRGSDFPQGFSLVLIIDDNDHSPPLTND
jgi:hypothetical protein